MSIIADSQQSLRYFDRGRRKSSICMRSSIWRVRRSGGRYFLLRTYVHPPGARPRATSPISSPSAYPPH
jgi:hypothetical protein